MMRKLKRFFGGKLFPCALLILLWALFILTLALYLPTALAPVAALERVLACLVAARIFLGRTPPEEKLSALLLILFLPWTGAVVVLFFRTPLPPVTGKAAGGDLFARMAAFSPAGKQSRLENATYFPIGESMYLSLLKDLASARRFILLEYYIMAGGSFLEDVRRILEEKAKAGVLVHVAYDGFGSALTLPASLHRDLTKRGIRVHVTRPLRLPFSDFNRRNHRKLAVIDGTVAYTGGINLADEYIGKKLRFGHWKDSAVRVTGKIACELAALFAEATNIALPPMEERAGGVPCALIADGETKSETRNGLNALCLLLANTQERIYLFTPYLVPDRILFAALAAAAGTGADVRIMIPHIPDKKTTFLLSRHYARELKRSGVKVREYTAGFLHAKSAVCDGKYAFISSYNLDYRSLYLQAECGIFVENAPLAKELEADFLAVWADGTEVNKEGFFAKLFRFLLQLFLPLM